MAIETTEELAATIRALDAYDLAELHHYVGLLADGTNNIDDNEHDVAHIIASIIMDD